MVAWLNKHKGAVQSAVVLLGIALIAPTLWKVLGRSTSNVHGRAFKGMLNQLAKPAEVGIFALLALYAVRISFKLEHGFKELGRWLLRALQIIHIPLASVVLGSAAIHGALYAWFLWRSDFHYWSGVAGLGAMLVVGTLGLLTIKMRKYRAVHLAAGLTLFGIVMIHIFTV